MQKWLVHCCFLLLAFPGFGQNNKKYWAQWNQNYLPVDVGQLLRNERHYADSVDANPDIPPMYARVDKFRFLAQYTGQVRPVMPEVLQSMKIVFRLYIGNPDQLDEVVKSEVLFRVGNEDIWMPIQEKVLQYLKKEGQAGDRIWLYCLFLNEHRSRQAFFNTFLISEFTR